MNKVQNRRMRQATAAVLAALIFLLSPGLSGYQAFAIGLEGTVHSDAPVLSWRGGLGQPMIKEHFVPVLPPTAVSKLPNAPAALPVSPGAPAGQPEAPLG